MGTNKTALATTQNRLLTDEQLLHAVELFAQGKSNIEVARHFIDTDRNLVEQDQIDPKGLRKRLSNALRVAEPSSEQFSITKYQRHYELHKSSVLAVIKNRYEQAIIAHVNFLSKEITRIAERIEAIDHMLNTAIDVDILGSGEYFTGEALRMKLTEQMTKLQAQYIEILSKASESVSGTPAPDGTPNGTPPEE